MKQIQHTLFLSTLGAFPITLGALSQEKKQTKIQNY